MEFQDQHHGNTVLTLLVNKMVSGIQKVEVYRQQIRRMPNLKL